jgi:hypothetical protein
MFGSTTMSVGPPIIKRCSMLSRRMRISRRRASTFAASMTASRGCRPRTLPPPSRLDANLRTSQAVRPISPNTTTNAMMKRAANGMPKRDSNIYVAPCFLPPLTGNRPKVNDAGTICRPEY